jgi:hypothetical protein
MPAADQKVRQLAWLQKLADIDISEVISTNAQRILRALESEEIDIGEVGHLLSLEPALTAKLLMIANSPFYGFHREIKDIEEAIVVLGARKLNDLVYSSVILVPETTHQHRKYIKHSLATAMYAKNIAERKGRPPENAFIAALLHCLPVIVGYEQGVEHLLSMKVLKESVSKLLIKLKLPDSAIHAVEGLYSEGSTNLDALCIRMAFNLSTIALGKSAAPFVHLINTEHDFSKLKLTPKEVALIFDEHQPELSHLLKLAG